MENKYYTFIEHYLPEATEEEKDEAQRSVHEFLMALLRLHAAATRDKKEKSDTVNWV